MLIRIGFHAWLYHNRLRRVATRAESMGRFEVVEAIEEELSALRQHVHETTAVPLRYLEGGFPIEPPFEPQFPNFLKGE